MKPAVLLDAGPVGVLSNPNMTPAVRAANRWLAAMLSAGRRVLLPEISDYEIRRELLLRGSTNALSRLAWLRTQLEFLPLNSSGMLAAADLWAMARRIGRPTAPPHALDADAILAGHANTLGGLTLVGTTNVGHLTLLTPTEFWLNITP